MSKDRTKVWREHVKAWRDSGKSQRQYAQGRGFTPQALSYWIRRLDRQGAIKVTSRSKSAQGGAKGLQQLVPVEVVDVVQKAPEASLRLTFPRLGIVEISGDFGAVAKLFQLVSQEAV